MNKTQLIQTGKRLGKKGLVEGASGNISLKQDNTITITRSGAVLDDLNEESFVTLGLEEEDERSREEASSDYIVHEAVYRSTDFKAVVHCHGIFNVVISLTENKITPPDFEGKLFVGDVLVLEGELKSQESAQLVAQTIKKNNLAVLKGHGIYCADYTLSGALNRIEYLEHSCEILYMLRLLNH